MSGATYITNIYIGEQEESPKDKGHFDYAIGRPMLKQGEKNMLDLTISNEEKVKVTVNPVTAGGNPVALDGTVEVIISSGDGTFEIQPDGLSVYLISGSLLGDTIYTIQGDADLGAGVVTIADVVTLHVEGAQAQALGLVADAPELK